MFFVFSYLHRNKNRTYYIAATKKLNQIDSNIYVNNLSSSISLNDQDKRAYLKILERSVRTGRSIQDEKNNNYNIKNDSQSNSLYFFRQYINKHLSSTTNNNNSQTSTEI